jgi:hypothetical protein
MVKWRMVGRAVLRVSSVTPVLRALFGAVTSNTYRGQTSAAVCIDTEEGGWTWGRVGSGLQRAAEELGLGSDLGFERALELIASRLRVNASPVLWMAGEAPEEEAPMEDLFALARVLDDGHGLTAVEYVVAQHFPREPTGEFDGVGIYESDRVVVITRASNALMLGASLDEAVRRSDVRAVAAVVKEHMADLLSSVRDKEFRSEVARELGLPSTGNLRSKAEGAPAAPDGA